MKDSTLHINNEPEFDDNCAHENNAISRLSQLAYQNKNKQQSCEIDFDALEFKDPVSSNEAWCYFGWLLGVIAPAAIFLKLFSYGFTLDHRPSAFGFAALFLAMNAVCAVAGRSMANQLSQAAADFERGSWSIMLAFLPLMGLVWGAVTGFTGGLLFFGIGALGGILFAMPIGIIAFTLFAIFHRCMAENGFIERKHFLPISYGICVTIAAFICGF
jgi:hypothetical protein